MKLFRITREKYSSDLSGEGSRLYGGRWNSKGYAVLYTSEHASLAAFEVLVNSPARMLPSDLMLIELNSDISTDPERVDREITGRIWKSYPAPKFLKEIGDKWIMSQSSLLLKVPSAVIPGEYNILVNPQHRGFNNIKIIHKEPFLFDKRIFE